MSVQTAPWMTGELFYCLLIFFAHYGYKHNANIRSKKLKKGASFCESKEWTESPAGHFSIY